MESVNNRLRILGAYIRRLLDTLFLTFLHLVNSWLNDSVIVSLRLIGMMLSESPQLALSYSSIIPRVTDDPPPVPGQYHIPGISEVMTFASSVCTAISQEQISHVP